MRPSSRSIVVLAAALSLGLAGCGSDAESEAGSDEGTDICTQLEDISNFEMESQESATMDPSDWTGMQSALQAYGDGLSEHYDPAIENADDTLAADLTTVRDASKQVTSLVTESASFEEYQQRTQETIDVDAFTAASDASARIDQYAKDNCAFAQQQPEQDPELQELPGLPESTEQQPAG